MQNRDVCSRLGAWILEVEAANWNAKDEIKAFFPNVTFLSANLVEFCIELNGSLHQLIVKIAYQTKVVKIERLLTKSEHLKKEL